MSLLHLAPTAGDLVANLCALETALGIASSRGSDLAIAPELALSGYAFPRCIGTVWIQPQPDRWLGAVAVAARLRGISVLLGAPERDTQDQRLHNSAFLIDQHGKLIGRSRKINTAADGWSSPGSAVAPIVLNALRIGCLICADAYTPNIAHSLAQAGAEILISPANWGPGVHGPAGEWEQRSRETGLPFIVCNRTGREQGLDFSGAESVVVIGGKRLIAYRSVEPAVLTLDWDIVARRPHSEAFVQDRL